MTDEKATAGTIARDWWRALQPDPAQGRPGDRAALAKLRRCATVAEAMGEPAALQLFRRLGYGKAQELPRVALAAAVLAHVRDDTWAKGGGPTTARLVGPESLEKPETALLKPLRFRRLMESDDWDDRLTAFRRMVALAGRALPVADLAEALLHWTDWRRRNWVLQYWNALPVPPAPTATHSQPAKDATP